MKERKFVEDQDQYDTNEVYNRTFPKRVQNTKYVKPELAGRGPLGIKLWEIFPQGKKAFPLRVLASGDWVRFEMVRSSDEQALAMALSHMYHKPEHKHRIGAATKQIAKEINANLDNKKGRFTVFKNSRIAWVTTWTQSRASRAIRPWQPR